MGDNYWWVDHFHSTRRHIFNHFDETSREKWLLQSNNWTSPGQPLTASVSDSAYMMTSTNTGDRLKFGKKSVIPFPRNLENRKHSKEYRNNLPGRTIFTKIRLPLLPYNQLKRFHWAGLFMSLGVKTWSQFNVLLFCLVLWFENPQVQNFICFAIFLWLPKGFLKRKSAGVDNKFQRFCSSRQRAVSRYSCCNRYRRPRSLLRFQQVIMLWTQTMNNPTI